MKRIKLQIGKMETEPDKHNNQQRTYTQRTVVIYHRGQNIYVNMRNQNDFLTYGMMINTME